MPLPKEIEELLRKHEGSIVEHECQGARFHSPRPLRIRRYNAGKSHSIYLCGTCRDNLSVYLSLYAAEKGLSWPVMRAFGNSLRSIAQTIIDLKGKNAKHD